MVMQVSGVAPMCVVVLSLTLFIFSHFIIGHPRNFNCINAIALHPLFARSATFPPKGISVLILEYFIW